MYTNEIVFSPIDTYKNKHSVPTSAIRNPVVQELHVDP